MTGSPEAVRSKRGGTGTTRLAAAAALAVVAALAPVGSGAPGPGAALAVRAAAAQDAPTRYVRYEHRGRTAYGILEDGTIRELSGDLFHDPRPTGRTVALEDVRLLVPVDPASVSKVVGTAVNTRRPGLELPPDAHPRWFAKFPTSLNRHGGEVELPPEASNLNYEGELVVVIGREARHVSEAEALDHVFGYAVGNDFSENTWYGEGAGREAPTRLISKATDTWAALGPAIVTGIDYRGLAVETRLNGEVVQRGSTEDLIQDVPELISNLSRYVTLLPGDLIYTGTVRFLPDRRRALEPGDVLEVEIEGLGLLRNRVVPMRMESGGGGGAADSRTLAAVPAFEVDASWPKPLPNDWILGQVSGMAVDDRDHVWIVQRPRTLTEREAGAVQEPPLAECCVPAPPVIEFDPEGNVVQAWGGPGEGYDWPASEHGIFVDHEDNVWIGSNGRGSAQVLKFTRDGRFLLQIGEAGVTGGSNDTTHLDQPADVLVDPEADEVYIADGYGNRRVIVFDATTGEYRRHWGAYGERPQDVDPGAYDPDAPPARHFRSPVHGLQMSHDGLLYVADRTNDRIQVFRRDGTFVEEGFVAPRTLAMGSVWDIDVSHDPEETYLYVPDGTGMKVWIVRRDDLEVVGSFGRGGRQAGQFNWVHNVAVDSRGNVYTSEVNTGKRIQKFRYLGSR